MLWGMSERPRADCHMEVGKQALVHRSQPTRTPFGERVELAGLRQASGVGRQPLVIGRHSGVGHRVGGTKVWEPCIVTASRCSAPCKLALPVAAPQHL